MSYEIFDCSVINYGWVCPKCETLQYVKKKCKNCGESKP